MTRVPVVVREAVQADALGLKALWEGLLERPAVEVSGLSDDDRVSLSIARNREQLNSKVMVAELDGRVVGSAFLRVLVVSPLDDESAVQLTHLFVDETTRNQGVEVALLEAAIGWAEERGISAVLSGSGANDREANRFLARLGLSQVALVRGASVPALRAQIRKEQASTLRGVPSAARRTGQVVAMRRSQRRGRAGGVTL